MGFKAPQIFSKYGDFFLKERSKKIDIILFVLNLLISLGIVFFAFKLINSKDVIKYTARGYLAIFFATLLGSSTVFLPAPNVAVLIAGGILFNPILSGVFGGLGWSLGEIVGYYVGRKSSKLVITSKRLSRYYLRAENYVRKWGLKILFLFSIIPNPAFDAFGIVAGIYKIPVLKFMAICAAGKVIGAIIISMLGHFGFLGHFSL